MRTSWGFQVVRELSLYSPYKVASSYHVARTATQDHWTQQKQWLKWLNDMKLSLKTKDTDKKTIIDFERDTNYAMVGSAGILIKIEKLPWLPNTDKVGYMQLARTSQFHEQLLLRHSDPTFSGSQNYENSFQEYMMRHIFGEELAHLTDESSDGRKTKWEEHHGHYMPYLDYYALTGYSSGLVLLGTRFTH